MRDAVGAHRGTCQGESLASSSLITESLLLSFRTRVVGLYPFNEKRRTTPLWPREVYILIANRPSASVRTAPSLGHQYRDTLTRESGTFESAMTRPAAIENTAERLLCGVAKRAENRNRYEKGQTIPAFFLFS